MAFFLKTVYPDQRFVFPLTLEAFLRLHSIWWKKYSSLQCGGQKKHRIALVINRSVSPLSATFFPFTESSNSFTITIPPVSLILSRIADIRAQLWLLLLNCEHSLLTAAGIGLWTFVHNCRRLIVRTRAQTIASPVKGDGAFAHPLALLHKNTHIYTYKYSHIYTYVQIFTLTYMQCRNQFWGAVENTVECCLMIGALHHQNHLSLFFVF